MTDLPPTMTAIVAPTPGDADALQAATRPLPVPGASEILIRVHAAGINRADILQRMGRYAVPPGASDIFGIECAGEVAAIGAGVTQFRVGDRAMALVTSGGYAEYCTAEAAVALPIPERFSFVEGAAIPEAFFTVWANVFETGRLKPGETALIHGGTSGIGTAAIQLAKGLGARVIVTAGSAAKCEACRKLGADVAIDYRTEDFVAAVLGATGDRGADVILDIVGGDYVARNYAAAAVDGRIVQIATQQGTRAEIDLRQIMSKRLVHTGSMLRPRPTAYKASLAEALRAHVLPLFTAGTVTPVIDSTFALANAGAAHRRMEGSEHIGKIVLTVGAGDTSS